MVETPMKVKLTPLRTAKTLSITIMEILTKEAKTGALTLLIQIIMS